MLFLCASLASGNASLPTLNLSLRLEIRRVVVGRAFFVKNTLGCMTELTFALICVQGLPSLYMVGSYSLCPVKYRAGGIIIFIYIGHFDICTAFCPKCFLMAAGGSAGGGSFRKGGMSPILTLDLAG